MSKKALSFIACSIVLAACAPEAPKKAILIPKIETVQVPVTVPGTPHIINVPTTVLLDKGFGIETYPKPIAEAPVSIKQFGKAVAKVLSIDGSSGTGFFISEDGLFLTNEHVIPMSECKKGGCPGTKLVRDFHVNGENQTFSEYEVLAQSHSDGQLDFTLLKVKLAPGEKVPFLDLELNKIEHNFSAENTKSYKVLGYPGGATLRFTNVKPNRHKNFDINYLGLVIGGNSGGPVIDDTTGRVIGLVKTRRTSFIKESPDRTAHESDGQATSIIDLLRNINAHNLLPDVVKQLNRRNVPIEVLSVNDAEKVIVPAAEFKAPSKKIFFSALREGNPMMASAIQEFNKYIGTDLESAVLDLMVSKSQIYDEDLSVAGITSLFQKQLQVGRAFEFSQAAASEITLELASQDKFSMDKIRPLILMQYFNPENRATFQQICRSSLPSGYQSVFAKMYLCVTNEDENGNSYLSEILPVLKLSGYEDISDFSVATSIGMVSGIPGITKAEDKKALIEFNNFVEQKNKYVEIIMSNDGQIMNAALQLTGPSAYKNTYPKK